MTIRPNQLKSIIRTAFVGGDAQDYVKHLENSHGKASLHNPRPRTVLLSGSSQYTTLTQSPRTRKLGHGKDPNRHCNRSTNA